MITSTSNSESKKKFCLSSGLTNSLNNSPQHKPLNWIIGSPQEDCLTDRFGRSYADSFLFLSNLESNVDENSSKGKTILSHIMTKRQASDILENNCSDNPYDSHTFWTYLFQMYFINADDQRSKQDDMLFFVKQFTISGFKLPSNDIEVYRSNSTNLPSLLSLDINWEETVYLNLILHHFNYYATCAVCTRTGNKELQILKKFTQAVYPSPSYRGAEDKGVSEEMTYPDLFFTIDNYEEAFSDIVVRDSELVCVELVAKDREDNFQSVLFQGSVRYGELKRAYDSQFSNRSKGLYHVLSSSFRWFSNNSIPNSVNNEKTNNDLDDEADFDHIEFLRMKGPGGKGVAEMAVRKVRKVKLQKFERNCFRFEHQQDLKYKRKQKSFKVGKEGIGDRHSSDPNMSNKHYYYHRHRNESGDGVKKGCSSSSFGGLQRKKSSSEDDKVDRVGVPDKVEIKGNKLQDELDDSHNSNSIGCLFKTYGQSYFSFKEQRRSNSLALHSFLTHICLPWHLIIADLLEPRGRSVISNT